MMGKREDAERAYQAGKQAVGEQRWSDAATALGRAITLNPSLTAAYPLLMQAAMSMKDHALAANTLLLAVDRAPQAVATMAPMLSKLSSGKQSKRAATPSARTATDAVYQIKITLKGSKPPIWRRVLITSATTLAKMHLIIQAVMGWYDCHLHAFTTADGREYGVPDPEEDAFWGHAPLDERKAKLWQVLTPKQPRMRYTYDFGDDWGHEILLEKIIPIDNTIRYPVCLTGKRATPPENVGGIHRYPRFLEALTDPANGEHRELLEYVGRVTFDPDAFDLDGVNDALQRIHVEEMTSVKTFYIR
jgi:hypothetical protein